MISRGPSIFVFLPVQAAACTRDRPLAPLGTRCSMRPYLFRLPKPACPVRSCALREKKMGVILEATVRGTSAYGRAARGQTAMDVPALCIPLPCTRCGMRKTKLEKCRLRRVLGIRTAASYLPPSGRCF